MNKLVSIVSSCYNGENYIERYLKMILSQTYRPLELILINNGSTDKTGEIIESYIDKIKDSNIILKYIKKENEGLGAAINDGLKHITGDYLIWPDTDDILMPESIEKRVNFLETHKGFGFVYSDGLVFNEDDLTTPVKKVKANIPKNGNLFKNVLSGRVVYTPCGYMQRMSAFLDVNPKKDIYPSKFGQNIQLLMPIAHKYKCGYLKENLYGRINRKNSLSKTSRNENPDAWRNHILGLEDNYIKTLQSIGGDALAYIPYIYYRDQRKLSAVSKNIGKAEYKKEKKVLREATKLLVSEIIKSFFKRG